jgi:hypothetical protein
MIKEFKQHYAVEYASQNTFLINERQELSSLFCTQEEHILFIKQLEIYKIIPWHIEECPRQCKNYVIFVYLFV